jgi:hypothetical protein
MSLTFFYSAGAQILSNGSKLKIKESSTSNFARESVPLFYRGRQRRYIIIDRKEGPKVSSLNMGAMSSTR